MRRLLLALSWLLAFPALAHEVRPAYLELHEHDSGEFSVLWKTPMRGDLRLSISPVFSGPTQVLTPITTRQVGGAAVQRWRIKALEPLRGRMLRIDGLDATMTDTLVRAEFADGANWTRRLTPQEPASMIPVQPSAWSVAIEYSTLGIEHILLGIDHLLFVLALLLITRGTWRLVQTITAFTLAHSITLALAALGFVQVPSAPVEAVIALSIVFVAAEALRAQRGQHGIAARAPWLVAFTFGLLHGFGFAGALAEIGLPQQHIPLALLFFNVGVELGQLLFVAAVLSMIVAIRRAQLRIPDGADRVLPYAIGSMAMFWVFQRVAAF